MLQNLILKFIEVKKHNPNHVNELLDLLQSEYVRGLISFTEYREIYRELHELGAVKPM
ncbi:MULTISPECIES: YppF family protein [Evansella]|jgi:hypothetical protein|uniref:YppF family protein n=1 Tax=Evansella TaxID=2837485 RepID=UPI0009973CEE|nr:MULTISPECIES: YppF family protein [Evansella]UTR10406.1 YppF family protein [Evansella sp. LMS18]